MKCRQHQKSAGQVFASHPYQGKSEEHFPDGRQNSIPNRSLDGNTVSEGGGQALFSVTAATPIADQKLVDTEPERREQRRMAKRGKYGAEKRQKELKNKKKREKKLLKKQLRKQESQGEPEKSGDEQVEQAEGVMEQADGVVELGGETSESDRSVEEN